MKDLTRRFLGSIGNKAIEREVDEELRFHLDLLTQQQLQNGDTLEDARAFALRRFGAVEPVKDECVEISKRNRYVIRALKSFFTLVFLAGVLIRIFSTELHVDRVGDLLIAIALMSRLFLYVRDLKPAVFRPKPDTPSPLMLNGTYKEPASLFDADNL